MSCNLPSSLNSAASSLADVSPRLNILLETFSLSTDEALCESLIRLMLASSNSGIVGFGVVALASYPNELAFTTKTT